MVSSKGQRSAHTPFQNTLPLRCFIPAIGTATVQLPNVPNKPQRHARVNIDRFKRHSMRSSCPDVTDP